MSKRTEYSCDKCSETQDERDAKHYHWFHLIRHKKFDAHFCSQACLTSWLAAGYGDGTDPNQTRFETDTAGNVSVTFDAEGARVMRAGRTRNDDSGFGGGDRDALGQELERAWAAEGLTVTRDAVVAIPAGE